MMGGDEEDYNYIQAYLGTVIHICTGTTSGFVELQSLKGVGFLLGEYE